MQTLEIEVAKTLRLRDDTSGNGIHAAEAYKLICKFLSGLPEIRELLRTDVEAAYEGDPAAKNFDEIILAYPCIEAIAIQRCAKQLYDQDVPLIPRIMTEYAHSLTGIDIHPGAAIGSHFFYRSRHRRRHWRNLRDWKPREALSRRNARGAEFSKRRKRSALSKATNGIRMWKTASSFIRMLRCSAAKPRSVPNQPLERAYFS